MIEEDSETPSISKVGFNSSGDMYVKKPLGPLPSELIKSGLGPGSDLADQQAQQRGENQESTESTRKLLTNYFSKLLGLNEEMIEAFLDAIRESGIIIHHRKEVKVFLSGEFKTTTTLLRKD
jgi:hypothetical protein